MIGRLQRSLKTRVTLFSLVIFVLSLWVLAYYASKMLRTDMEQLLGDPTKARTLLGWNPTKTSFRELIRIMVEHDMRFVKKLKVRAEM